MAKAKRLIEKYYNYIDIFIVVVDARAPFSSIHDSFAQKQIAHKNTILIMAKSDYANPKQTEKWISYFQKSFFAVLELNLTKNNLVQKKTKTNFR